MPASTLVDDSAVKRAAEAAASALRHARDESIRLERIHHFALVGEEISVRTTGYATPSSTLPIVGAPVTNPVSRQPYTQRLSALPGALSLEVEARFVTDDGLSGSELMFDRNGVPKRIDAAGHHLLTTGDLLFELNRSRYRVEVSPTSGRISVFPS